MITRIATSESTSLVGILRKDLQRELFPAHLELVPQLNELYELQLAFYESRILTDAEVVKQGAYFAQVNGQPTRHYLICKGESLRLAEHSSSRLKAFFKTNQFKTGYATHGLFPYRGKFHPQMVKGILNVMGLKPGETVLDPMMGSGTTLVEATLMGIHSIGVDSSPFCRFMTQAKLDGFRVPLSPVEWALHNAESVFEHFTRTAGHPNHRASKAKPSQVKLRLERGGKRSVNLNQNLAEVLELEPVRNYLHLAFLDSAGYSVRSQRRSPFDQFRAILERYLFVARKIQGVLEGMESELGKGTALEGDARNLSIENNSVEGILFSPPYSFAIDYVANDAFHLRSMGVDLQSLKQDMVGLRGLTVREKYEHYVHDMRQVLKECSRVLRPGRICAIVVGTNDQQLSRILGVPIEDVTSIPDVLVKIADECGLATVRRLQRQITGMANTMRTEFILFLRKV